MQVSCPACRGVFRSKLRVWCLIMIMVSGPLRAVVDSVCVWPHTNVFRVVLSRLSSACLTRRVTRNVDWARLSTLSSSLQCWDVMLGSLDGIVDFSDRFDGRPELKSLWFQDRFHAQPLMDGPPRLCRL